MNITDITAELQRMFPLSWRMQRAYRLPTGVLGEPYFIRWLPDARPFGEGWNDATFSEDGVVQLNTFRNPVQIAQYALDQYERCDEASAKARFLAQADYFVRAQRADGAYPYPIALPAYSANPGFISAMAQGEVASVLLRAFALTRNDAYLEAGKSALRPLLRSVDDGGASYIDGEDLFFEEIAADPPCHILNGHIYAAFGLWEYVAAGFADAALCNAHQTALATLDRWLERFDLGGWSSYDLALDENGRRHFASLWYHQFHIAQLRVFAAMTGRPRFHTMADRWEGALTRFNVRAAVWEHGAKSLVSACGRRARGRVRSPFVPMRTT